MLNIVVEGKAVAKGRARFTKTGRPYTPKKTRHGEAQVKAAALEQIGFPRLEGPLQVTINVWIEPPVSWPKWKREQALSGKLYPSGRPDVDNYSKLAFDALNGVAWLDDCQVVRLTCEKGYAAEGRTVINVYAINP